MKKGGCLDKKTKNHLSLYPILKIRKLRHSVTADKQQSWEMNSSSIAPESEFFKLNFLVRLQGEKCQRISRTEPESWFDIWKSQKGEAKRLKRS